MPSAPPAIPDGRNVVLGALTGPHRRFALRVGSAVRYRPTVAPFATLPDTPTAADWQDLAGLIGDSVAVLIRPLPELPPGWRRHQGWPVLQMVHRGTLPAGAGATADLAPLGRADVPEMRALVALTRPGPFLADTIELGRYLGVRRDGRLVAMAGERFRPPGGTEVSAICTHPDFRGQGLAEQLTAAVMQGILGRGEVPFLHVVSDNTAAVRLYEKLGFATSLRFEAVAVSRPGNESPDLSELTVH